MGRVIPLFDKLVNAITGTGTSRDARSYNAYLSRPLTQQEIANAYSGSGLMRKIVGIPAFDMVREWREWSGLDDDEAAAIYDEEKRLGLRQKARQAEVLRGMGGAAMILGLPGNLSEPAPATVTKGGLAFVHVVSRWHLSFDALQDDANQAGFGEPLMWKMQTTTGQQTIHPSRVIPFRADTTAAMALPGAWAGNDAFWGESTVQQVLEAVQDNDSARAAVAALMSKARTLKIGIPRLMELVQGDDGTGPVAKRLAALTLAESVHNAFIFDAGDPETGKGGETIQDSEYSFAGIKDVLNCAGEFVAAISDIPATRLLGRAPEGMNSSGDSQQKDWSKKVRAQQTLDLGPCLDRLDRYLIPSAIGSTPPTVSYDFAPLETESEGERAVRFKTEAEAVEIVRNMDAMPEQAFNRGVQSWLVEEGHLPELEAALAELPDEERYGIAPESGAPAKGGDPASASEGDPLEGGSPDLVGDAAPRSLYVSRKLLNGAELAKWAKAQGFETTLAPEDMHVTVLFSRTAVDWLKMGEGWGTEADGGVVVKAGGPRALEQFDGGAVVLQFASWSLSSRHDDMVRAGASHDYAEYIPHVTLSYALPEGVDLDAIKPFTGELRFGPELFEPLDDDWKSKIEEA
jgi:phage-related protein (TIGR01555 family)